MISPTGFGRRTRGIWNFLASCVATGAAALGLSLAAPLAAFGQVPGAVFTQASGISSVDTGNGAVSHIAVDAAGDIFVGSMNGVTNLSSIEEYPAGSTTAVVLVSKMAAGQGATLGVTLDALGNVYVADAADQAIVFVPNVTGTGYPTGADYTKIPECSGPNGSLPTPLPTTACSLFHQPNVTNANNIPGNVPGGYGYYLQFIDVGVDAAGNIYTLSKYTGGTTANTGYANTQNMIIKWPAGGGTPSTVADNLSNNNGNGTAEIAVDPAGDIYYAPGMAGSTIGYLAAGATAITAGVATTNTLPAWGSGFTQPMGVSLDWSGNLYVTDMIQASGTTATSTSSQIVEFPKVAGAVSPANGYTLSNSMSTAASGPSNQFNGTFGPSTGVGISGAGNIVYAGAYPNSLNWLLVNWASYGSTAAGSTSAAQWLNVSFTSAVTLGSLTTTGPFAQGATGQTCVAGMAYTKNQFCVASVTYTPTAAGNQTGTLVAWNGASTAIGTANLAGVGLASSVALSSLSPSTMQAGGATFTLTLTGSGFLSSATAYWGATALTTTFVSATSLTASVPAALYATAGSDPVTVQQFGGTTSAVNFTVTAPPPPPPAITLSNGGNIAINPGAGTGNTSVITVTPWNGYTGTINLSCTISGVANAINAPVCYPGPITVGSTSSYSVKITGATAVTFPLVIQSEGPGMARTNGLIVGGSGVALAGLLLLAAPRRRRWSRGLAVVLASSMLLSAGCGGSNSSGTAPVAVSTPGTYTVTVTGTDSNVKTITASTTVMVTLN